MMAATRLLARHRLVWPSSRLIRSSRPLDVLTAQRCTKAVGSTRSMTMSNKIPIWLDCDP